MKKEKIKMGMMAGASKALEFMNSHPKAGSEEVLPFVMKNINEKGKVKIGAMAGASKAIEYREKLKLKDKEILQKIMAESDEILGNIEKE